MVFRSVSCYFPKWVHTKFSGGFPIGFRLSACGFLRVSCGVSSGFPAGFPWDACRFSKAFLWVSNPKTHDFRGPFQWPYYGAKNGPKLRSPNLDLTVALKILQQLLKTSYTLSYCVITSRNPPQQCQANAKQVLQHAIEKLVISRAHFKGHIRDQEQGHKCCHHNGPPQSGCCVVLLLMKCIKYQQYP